MSRERVLQRRLRTLETLGEAIGALRSLSAQHFRAARAPLAAAREYRDEAERFLGVLDGSGATSVSEGPPGIILVAADLGLVGDYTRRLVREALELRAEAGPGPLLCLGRRAVSLLAQAGVEPVSVHPAPVSVAGLPALLLSLVDTLFSLRRRGELGALWLVAARFEGAGCYSPARVPLLPVPAPEPLAPLATSPYCGAETVRTVIVREYLYASLYEWLLESMASEHGKRLVMTESARSWLDDHESTARRKLAALRRESSTQELLEVIVSARATLRDAGGAP